MDQLVVITFVFLLMHGQVQSFTTRNVLEDYDTFADELGIVAANIAYTIEGTEEIVDEHIVVTDKEEDIITPEARIIFDYEKGIVVTKFSASEEIGTEDVCFVSNFDAGVWIGDIKEAVKNAQGDVTAPLNETKEYYKSTGEQIDVEMLSSHAREMCSVNKALITLKMADNSADGPPTDPEMEALCWGCYVYCSSWSGCRTRCYWTC